MVLTADKRNSVGLIKNIFVMDPSNINIILGNNMITSIRYAREKNREKREREGEREREI